MIAAQQQSLNAVKAALQNAQARDEGSKARGRAGEPFVCATVGLRINDLKNVVDALERAPVEFAAGIERLKKDAQEIEAVSDQVARKVAAVTAERDAAQKLVSEQFDLLNEMKAERDALKAELARISEELGLPPTIGPAPGELSKWLLKPGEIAIRKDDYERLIASLPTGPRAVR